nr:hypothetical protein BaRGS_008018 [Batillaria attramentaria]
MVAVAFNQKEQRVLEKSLSTLRLEQDYSLKLLDLHNRTVKVHFRQMKDRVSRIKSYLTPEEISKLRQLEAEGKLRPMYPPVCLGNAMKIAAAARRLNSSHGRRSQPLSRAKSALPRVNVPGNGPRSQSSIAPPPGNLRRSNSVTGVFMDVPPPRNGHRPGSASEVVGRTTPAPEIRVTSTSGSKTAGPKPVIVNGKTGDARHNGVHLRVDGVGKRPSSSGVRQPSNQSQHQNQNQHLLSNSSSSSMDSSGSKRPSSKASLAGHASSDKSKHNPRLSASTTHSRVPQNSHSRAPFSSHVVTEKEARERAEEGEEQGPGEVNGHAANNGSTPRPPHSYDRKSSFASLNDDTMDSALGEDLYAERRAELLEEEQYRSASITRRKDAFLKEVDRYLREHPPLSVTMAARSLALSQKNSPEEQAEEGDDENADKGLGAALFRRRRPLRVEFDATPTYMPEDNYRERLMGLWRDMNKCRYLRVPEEMIDLSGINTLAADTMKLFQVIKQQDMEPLSNAWKE